MQPDQFDKFFSGELSRKKLATMLYKLAQKETSSLRQQAEICFFFDQSQFS